MARPLILPTRIYASLSVRSVRILGSATWTTEETSGDPLNHSSLQGRLRLKNEHDQGEKKKLLSLDGHRSFPIPTEIFILSFFPVCIGTETTRKANLRGF